MRGVAERLGVGETFEPTPVGVYFGEDGVDPYFDGEGPLRNGCDLRGACMTGCPRGAKNSLDLNYLWLAERRGAVDPRRDAACGVWPVMGTADVARRDEQGNLPREGRRARGGRARERCGILFRSGLGGPRVGDDVRTNSEVIVGASTARADVDYSRGVAITSMIRADADTHIQPVRYGKGSNLMGLLGTIMVDEPGLARWRAAAVRHPWQFANTYRLHRWSERTVILLVMQTRESTLQRAHDEARAADDARLERAGPDPGRQRGCAHRRRADRRLPGQLGERGAARHADDGAHPRRRDREQSTGSTASQAPGVHVVDGAAVANLGVNPSLTIAAQAERAMSLWEGRSRGRTAAA